MVRTLGPRSVSSFLKVFLDVGFVVFAISLIGMGVVALLSAIGMSNPDFLAQWRYPWGDTVLAKTPRRAAQLLYVCIVLLGSLGMSSQLRKIFTTLVQGSPFVIENAKRLRLIGLILAIMEGSRFAIFALITFGLHERSRFVEPEINFTALFAIGAMFVLAEVFELGVRMKKDLELTI